MNKEITARLFIREKYETEYRNWDDLTAEQQREYSERLDRTSALSSGFRENTKK